MRAERLQQEATCQCGWWRFIVFEREGNDMKKVLAVAVLCFFVLLGKGFSQELSDNQANNLLNLQRYLKAERLESQVNNEPQDIDEAINIIKNLINREEGITTSTAVWFSTDPNDLAPLKGTKWSFTYTIKGTTSTTYTDTITFGSTVDSNSDGIVALYCENQYGVIGTVFYTDLLQGGRGFGTVIKGTLLTEYYSFTVNGAIATGVYRAKINSTDEYTDLFSMTGLKISGPNTTTSVQSTTTTIPATTTTISGGGCPADYPVDCGDGCCPSSHPVCGTGENVGKCYAQPTTTSTISNTGTTTQPTTIPTTTTTISGGGCPADYPVDCGNGYCCPSDYPVCGTDANGATCSKDGGGGKPTCVAETILQNDEESLNVLREFRDKVLLKTETGKKYVDLYYQYSPAIVTLIEQNPGLKQQVRTSIMAKMPTIKHRLKGMPRDK
jgi:hypothetical protein